MITKEKAKEALAKMPDTFSVEELIERLIFLEKIEKGLQQSADGQLKSEEEVNTALAKWFK